MINKTYKLNKELHQLVKKNAKKYGIKINCNEEDPRYSDDHTPYDNTNIWIDKNGNKKSESYMNDQDKWDHLDEAACRLILAPEIREILLAFKEPLGQNPDFKRDEFEQWSDTDKYGAYGFFTREIIFIGQLKSQAEALANRWLDGLEPMINREPEKVLEEVIENLKTI